MNRNLWLTTINGLRYLSARPPASRARTWEPSSAALDAREVNQDLEDLCRVLDDLKKGATR